jgi:hypothetical protein
LRIISCVLGVIIALTVVWQCSNPNDPGQLIPNVPPDTRLGNIPPDDVTGNYPTFALVKVYWTGSDADGYVVAYRYRWSYIGSNNDTIWRPWVEIRALDSLDNPAGNANAAAFVFESNRDLNPHVFEIKAVDNEGAEDPTPARLRIWTTKAIPPVTQIKVAPDSNSQVYMIDHVSDTWNGIKFVFGGTDDDGEIVDYSWKIDSKPWSQFSILNEVVVLSSDLGDPLTGKHYITVKARDNTLIEDQNPPRIAFNVIVPTWEKQLLLVDNTRDGIGVPGSPTDADVDNFYTDLLVAKNRTNYDMWDVKQKGGFPDRKTLGQYRILLWYDDHYLVDLGAQISANDLDALKEYLFVGGKLIVSGWKASNMFSSSAVADTFFYNFAHINLGLKEVPSRDFKGATGTLGFPSINVDASKLPASWGGLMDRIQIMEPRGLAETIYTFGSATSDPNFQNKPVAVRYVGTTYNVVFLGFPLYFMDKQKAIDILDGALRSMGEN